MWPFFEKHAVFEKDFFHLFEAENCRFPLHFHRAFEVIYVNEGEVSISIDEKKVVVQSHQLAFIFPNQLHDVDTPDHSVITVLIFSPEWIGDFYMNYKGLIPDDNILRLESAPDFSKLNSIYAQKSFLYGLCADLTGEKAFVQGKHSPQTKVLYKMLFYVEQNYASDCTLKAVAKHLQYDYQYLSKLFVRLMKMSFTEYVNHYRISQACYLLKNSNQTIGEIANQCGYSNLRSFHRNFREIASRSPRTYRVSTF